MQIAVGRAEDY